MILMNKKEGVDLVNPRLQNHLLVLKAKRRYSIILVETLPN
jgi:hypothetical protein